MLSEKDVYLSVVSAGIDNLLLYVSDINNAVLYTPLKKEVQREIETTNSTFKQRFYQAFGETELVNNMFDAVLQADRLFVAYVDTVAGNGDPTPILQKWQEANNKIAFYFSEISSFWHYSEWSGLLQHNIDLYVTLTNHMKKKQYEQYIKTLPICRRISVDIADYISEGIIFMGKQQ